MRKVNKPHPSDVYHCLFAVSGNYFITKVSYVEGRTEQKSVEHDVLMLVRQTGVSVARI